MCVASYMKIHTSYKNLSGGKSRQYQGILQDLFQVLSFEGPLGTVESKIEILYMNGKYYMRWVIVFKT